MLPLDLPAAGTSTYQAIDVAPNHPLGLMVFSRYIIMRAAPLIAAVIMTAGATALASQPSSPRAEHHGHTQHSPTSKADHATAPGHTGHHGIAENRSAQPQPTVDTRNGSQSHCPIALAPGHCELCLDRDVVQVSLLRKRHEGLTGRDSRLSLTNPGSPSASYSETGYAALARPPDRPRAHILPSRPLSLAHRFRI